MKFTINSRQDLDAIQGTPEHSEFIKYLKGTITQRRNTQEYPENYGKPDYTGEILEPIWESFEDTSIIEKFSFTKEDLA